MRFEKNVEDRHVSIKLLEDKLDSRIAASLKSEFIQLNASGTRNMVLDLEGVQYADSSGLSAILVANRLCSNQNGIFVLCNVGDHIQKLIKISQLDSVLNVLPTQDEAREAVFMAEIEKEISSGEGSESEAL